jgi:hypothetical protein
VKTLKNRLEAFLKGLAHPAIYWKLMELENGIKMFLKVKT